MTTAERIKKFQPGIDTGMDDKNFNRLQKKSAGNTVKKQENDTVNNPTPEQVAENNQIANVQPDNKPSVTSDYIPPTRVDFGDEYTPEQQQKDLTDPNKGYIHVLNELNKPYALESKEKQEARDKKERQRSAISAIGDGFAALANVIGTTAGGSSQQLTSLSESNARRREYMRQLREQDEDKRKANMMRVGQLKANQDMTREKLQLQKEMIKDRNALREQQNILREYELRLREAKTQIDQQRIIGLIDAKQKELELRENDLGIKESYYNSIAGARNKTANAAVQNASTNAKKAEDTAWYNKEKAKYFGTNGTNAFQFAPQPKQTNTASKTPATNKKSKDPLGLGI